MPTRMLRDWTDSDRFDGISAEAERLFTRLVMKADDYGRFHAEVRRVRSACFPLLTTLRPTDIDSWLHELAERSLILRYRVDDRDLLVILRFRQRLKHSVPKFPPPSGKNPDWRPEDDDLPEVAGSSGKFPPDVETDVETETDIPPPPAAAKVPKKKRASVQAPSPSRELSEHYVARWQAKYGGKYPFKPVDGVKCAELLELCGGSVDDAKATMDRYLADTGNFYRGHSLALLTSASQLPRFMVGSIVESELLGIDKPRELTDEDLAVLKGAD